jgi:hypothetical protein
MSNVLHIHPQDIQHLFELHNIFKTSACQTGCSTAVASFLMIGALIVIKCACLCLMLPGINVVNNVIFPGILPCTGAIVLSIPFIVYSVRRSREKNIHRKELIEWNLMLLKWLRVDRMEEEKIIDFINENFLKPKWTKEYSAKVINDIKERYPKKKADQTPEQKTMIKALNGVCTKIYKKK